MPKLTKPTNRALLQQQTGAQGKKARDETGSSSADQALARIGQAPDPKAVIAGESTDVPTNSPLKRSSARLRNSPNAKRQDAATKKTKTGSSDSPADFATVEPAEGTAMPLADGGTTPTVINSAEIEDETMLTATDNEILQDSGVRKTRRQNPIYREESDDDLPKKSTKGKEVQESSSMDTTTSKKVEVDLSDSDGEDMGEEEQTGEEDPKDDGDSDDNFFISPVKQQPALAKLTRGRQHKPFSPAGNLTSTLTSLVSL